jgi:hypothetical protein
MFPHLVFAGRGREEGRTHKGTLTRFLQRELVVGRKGEKIGDQGVSLGSWVRIRIGIRFEARY